MSYSNGIFQTYKFTGLDLDTAGQSAEKISGPKGATGRVVSMNGVITGATSTAATTVTVKNNGSAETYGRLTVPIGVAEAIANDFDVDDQGAAPQDASRIPADAVLELDSDGASGGTTAAADVYVTILWDAVGP